MKLISQMTQTELAAFIYTHLDNRGIQIVLSGGATVCIFSNDRYVSKDLDFVNQYRISQAMNKLGFEEVGRHFTHPETEFFVEFPPGPPMAGGDPLTDIDLLHFETGILRIISPASCVKARLAHFYHWGDRQCLQQAVMVAESHDVDTKEIADWSAREGKLEEFEEFRASIGRYSHPNTQIAHLSMSKPFAQPTRPLSMESSTTSTTYAAKTTSAMDIAPAATTIIATTGVMTIIITIIITTIVDTATTTSLFRTQQMLYHSIARAWNAG